MRNSYIKINKNEVLFCGRSNSEIGIYVRYMAICDNFETDVLTWKQVCANFDRKERKVVSEMFGILPEVSPKFDEVEPKFDEVSPKLVRSLPEVCPKSDSKNNDLDTARVYNIYNNNIHNIPDQTRPDNITTFSDKSSKVVVKSETFDLTAINSVLKKYKLPEIKSLTETRKTKLKARIKDCGGFKEFLGQMEAALANSSFLRGDNAKGWHADFDFFLQASSWQKAIEGSYSDQVKQTAPDAPDFSWI